MILTKEDYIFCEECQEYIDFWKYDRSIKNTGHCKHNWRYVSEEEFKQCLKDCLEDGCIIFKDGEYKEVF